MDTSSLSLKPERLAQLEEYARLHNQSATEALDDLLAASLETDKQEYEEAVQAATRGYEDVKAGRTRSTEEVHEAMRLKYGL